MKSTLIALMFLAFAAPVLAGGDRDDTRRANFVALVPAAADELAAELALIGARLPAAGWPTNKIVIPGDGANSKLVKAMLGTAGPRMPIGGPAVAPDKIAAVKAWIDSGATEAEFTKTVQPIFRASCTGCHGASASTLSLDTFQALQRSVGPR